MATNYIQPGDVVEVAKSSTSAGDHVLIKKMPGVALTDTDANGNIRMATKGVFDLSVKAANDAGNVAISVGDKIYDDGGTLNADATNGTLYGKAMAAITSGSTKTIPVMLVQA